MPETRISLILRLRECSDVQAWQEFVDIYVPALYRLALRKGLQPVDAEDVTQEILIGVARAVERFTPDRERATFRSWLGTIARNLIADACRRRARLPQVGASSESWPEQLEGSNRASIGSPALEARPVELDEQFESELRLALFGHAARLVQQRVQPGTWQAFYRTSVLNQPADQVASELQMSTGTVYVSRCRVLKMMRREVEQLRDYYEANDATPPPPSAQPKAAAEAVSAPARKAQP